MAGDNQSQNDLRDQRAIFRYFELRHGSSPSKKALIKCNNDLNSTTIFDDDRMLPKIGVNASYMAQTSSSRFKSYSIDVNKTLDFRNRK